MATATTPTRITTDARISRTGTVRIVACLWGACARLAGFLRTAVGLGDDPDNGGGIVRDGQQILVAWGDLALGEDPVADPGQQPGPVLAADQHDRELRDLAGMDQGECLEQLVQGAEPARQHHERLRVLDEYGLADEEVPELQADLDIVIQPHLHGQLDAQAHRDTTNLRRALVGRFHDPGASPGDHGVAGLGERRRDALGQLIVGDVRLGPGRPEDRHGRAWIFPSSRTSTTYIGSLDGAGITAAFGSSRHSLSAWWITAASRAPSCPIATSRWSTTPMCRSAWDSADPAPSSPRRFARCASITAWRFRFRCRPTWRWRPRPGS